MTDSAAGRIRAFLELWHGRCGGPRPDRITYVTNSGNAEPDAWLHETDLRALLAEREQLVKRVTDSEDHSWAKVMERDEAIRRAERAEAGHDEDVRAVAEACAGVVDGTAPQPVRHEYAVRRLRDRFADRIAELEQRDAASGRLP